MNVLIVVDIQNDFLPGGALAVPDGDEVIPVANHAMTRFDRIVATQDWHPAGHLSFASSHPDKNVGELIELDGLNQILWPDHCIQDSPGARLADTLHTEQIEKIIYKGTHPRIDSYSGFFDNGHLQATGLESYLKSAGAASCFVLGLATDYCVKFTALDSQKCGFETTVLIDGCRAVNLHPEDERLAIDELRQAGVKVLRSDEITLD